MKCGEHPQKCFSFLRLITPPDSLLRMLFSDPLAGSSSLMRVPASEQSDIDTIVDTQILLVYLAF